MFSLSIFWILKSLVVKLSVVSCRVVLSSSWHLASSPNLRGSHQLQEISSRRTKSDGMNHVENRDYAYPRSHFDQIQTPLPPMILIKHSSHLTQKSHTMTDPFREGINLTYERSHHTRLSMNVISNAPSHLPGFQEIYHEIKLKFV